MRKNTLKVKEVKEVKEVKRIKKPNLEFCGLKLSQCNKKLQPTKEVTFLIWNILAEVTCPFATELCKKYCYAKKTEILYPATLERNKMNYRLSKESEFVENMIVFIRSELIKSSKQGKKILFRIHESGDFYSFDYLKKWIEIANVFKGENITFQAYTKSLPHIVRYMVETGSLLDDININFTASIWDDTDPIQKRIASNLGLQTFEAFKKEIVTEKIKEGYSECDCVSCGDCQKCYKREVKKICVCIH